MAPDLQLYPALAGAVLASAAIAAAQTALPSGDDVDGSISAPMEVDSYSVTANAGDRILVSVGELADDTGQFIPWVRIFEPGGGGSLLQGDFGTAADIDLVAPATGTYPVLVTDITTTSVGDDTGNYRIHSLILPGPFLVTDDGGSLTSGETVDGTIHTGDVDPWGLKANAGDRILVHVAELSDQSGSFIAWLRIYGPDGSLLDADFGIASGLDAADLDLEAPVSGTFVVVVADLTTSDLGADTGSYRLHTGIVPGPFHPADDGGTLMNATTQNGTITLGDLDLWSFAANAGDSIVVTMNELTDHGGFRPWVRLYGPDGATLAAVSNVTTAVASATAPSSGVYIAAVADLTTSDLGEDTGTYSITVHGLTAPAPSPKLRAEPAGIGQVLVSWPLPADGWVLKQNDGLEPPDWVPAPAAAREGPWMNLIVPSEVPFRAYRLEGP